MSDDKPDTTTMTSVRARRKYNDEDAAFCVVQWCSGIPQREIAQHFGYKNTTMVCIWIRSFIKKYYPDVPVMGPERYGGTCVGLIDGFGAARKPLANIAFCHFMAQRQERGL